MRSYNCIGIGTSPASVIEMAARQMEGEVTLMIDRAPRVGGSWGRTNFPGIGDVEPGPHYLQNADGVIPFLKDMIGIETVPMEPEPKFFLPQRVFGKTWTSFANKWATGVQRPGSFPPRSLVDVKHLVGPYYRAGRHKMSAKTPRMDGGFRYFVGGTVELSRKLETFIEERELATQLETSVQAVSVDTSAGRVTVETDKGTYLADHFILSSCAVLDHITVDGKVFKLPGERIPMVQLHLLVSTYQSNVLSFGQFINSRYLSLVSDLTPYMSEEGKATGLGLIGCLVKADLPQTDDTVAMVVDELRHHGILEADTTVVRTKWTTYDIPHRQDDELASVEAALGPYVSGLSTHAFSLSISNAVKRWRALQDKASPPLAAAAT